MTKSIPAPDAARLDGRVVVVTGAGRGIGAAYAKLAAAQGAAVIVNDLGVSLEGDTTGSPAEQVVDAIKASGGRAAMSGHNISDSAGAHQLIEQAISTFGGVDVLINNAGILRDAMLVTMTANDFDDVIAVHLRGSFLTTQAAAQHWRARRTLGDVKDRTVVQTTSIAGLHGNVGQFNYSAAKAGVAAMAINTHLELNARYGVRSYAVAPSARTRLTENSPGAADAVAKPFAADAFDFFDPDNLAPFVVWLAAPNCPAPSGSIFGVEGDQVRRYQPWTIAEEISNGARWTMTELDAQAPKLWRNGIGLMPVREVAARTARHVDQLRGAQ